MTSHASAQHKIDRYLATLRKLLAGMADADRDDIVAELRSHLLEQAQGPGEMTAESVDRAIAALGSPEDLADAYLTEDLLRRAARHHHLPARRWAA